MSRTRSLALVSVLVLSATHAFADDPDSKKDLYQGKSISKATSIDEIYEKKGDGSYYDDSSNPIRTSEMVGAGAQGVLGIGADMAMKKLGEKVENNAFAKYLPNEYQRVVAADKALETARKAYYKAGGKKLEKDEEAFKDARDGYWYTYDEPHTGFGIGTNGQMTTVTTYTKEKAFEPPHPKEAAKLKPVVEEEEKMLASELAAYKAAARESEKAGTALAEARGTFDTVAKRSTAEGKALRSAGLTAKTLRIGGDVVMIYLLADSAVQGVMMIPGLSDVHPGLLPTAKAAVYLGDKQYQSLMNIDPETGKKIDKTGDAR